MFSGVLIFILGFLVASFLALLAAPAIWRRAVVLTRRRLEASVPLTMNELQADKDRLRADHAVRVRQVEMALEREREKSAEQAITLGRDREEFKRRDAEKAGMEARIEELERLSLERQTEIEARAATIAELENAVVERERLLEESEVELGRMAALYEEAALTATNRQIDLVARESEVDRLAKENNTLRASRRELEKQLHAAEAERKGDREALKVERRRSLDAEKRLDRSIASISDLEEKLERREKELARLRDTVRAAGREEGDLGVRLAAEQSERLKLEAEIASLAAKLAEAERNAGDETTAVPRNASRLEDRLRLLTRENRMLRAELAGGARIAPAEGARSDEEVLREAIGEIAAEVVNLTMALEGEDSPLARIVAEEPSGDTARPDSAPPSIAERVRALRKAAAE